jgi:hypothetical protein
MKKKMKKPSAKKGKGAVAPMSGKAMKALAGKAPKGKKGKKNPFGHEGE